MGGGGAPFFGVFGPLRELMGLEGLVYAMADDAALVHTILDDLTDFRLALLGKVLEDVHVDQVLFFEDVCSTRGPMVGPGMFKEFFAPVFRRTISELRGMGVREFFVDTDGNAMSLIPDLIACGVTGLVPCEVNAGMDAAELRETFPTLNLSAGIDKCALARSPEEIDAELERRFATAWGEGRYTPRQDHGIPPDVPWFNMQHYARHYLARCAGPEDGR